MNPSESPVPAAHFHHPVRVYWEDTDAGGIVFYANYLKFFERARTEWLRALGHRQQAMVDATGCMFVVQETSVRYIKPARLDDNLAVSVRLARQLADADPEQAKGILDQLGLDLQDAVQELDAPGAGRVITSEREPLKQA